MSGKVLLSDRDGILSLMPRKDGSLQARERPADCRPEARRMPQWFAVYTSPRHEKRVAQYLNAREIEHYLPLYSARHKWRSGSTATLDLPLFPGYMFVRIDRAARAHVLQVPGILDIVGGTGRQPVPLPDVEIDALRAGLPFRNAEPHPLLTVGQRARIRSGALTGMEGVVARLKGSLRVILTLDLILRSVSVEVTAEELESLDAAPDCVRGYETCPSLGAA